MASPSGHVRIIAGKWRGRKLGFPQIKDLRPSPDAVRETLFNWLRADIADANCLDLYAGSGALGLEAASRGASRVTLLDQNPLVVKQLHQNVTTLEASDQVEVIRSKAYQFVAECQIRYQIVFIDPPFASLELEQICTALLNSSLLDKGALIYIESARSKQPLPISPSWHIIRQKTMGRVMSTLIDTSTS